MKSLIHRFFMCFLLVSVLGFLPGCWDYQRINYRDQILGIGVDTAAENSSELEYTFQIPTFESAGGQGGGTLTGPTSSKQYKNVSVVGKSLADAMSHAQTELDKNLFLGNLQTVVLGRNLNSNQVNKVIAELMRNPQIDRLAYVLIASNKAQDIYNIKTQETPADMISSSFDGSVTEVGYCTRTRIWQFWRDKLEAGVEPLVGLVDAGGDHLNMSGMVAFRGTDPVLELSPDDALAVNFLRNDVKRINMAFRTEIGTISIGNVTATSHLSVVNSSLSSPRLSAFVRVNGILLQDDIKESTRTVTTSVIAHYEQVVEKELEERISRAFNLAQAKGCDVFGYGIRVLVRHPGEIATIDQKWSDAFKKAKFTVQVKMDITKKGVVM